jgi:hypothetical protein
VSNPWQRSLKVGKGSKALVASIEYRISVLDDRVARLPQVPDWYVSVMWQVYKKKDAMTIADSKTLGSKMYGGVMGFMYGEAIAALALLEEDMNALEAEMLARENARQNGAKSKGRRPSNKPDKDILLKLYDKNLAKYGSEYEARATSVKQVHTDYGVSDKTAGTWLNLAGITKLKTK